jgi:hypothetical protein
MGLYADADAMGARYDDPANLLERTGRVLLGAGGYVAWPALGLRAVLSAYNLADAQVNDVLHFPLPGRSLFVTLHASYPRTEPPKESLE